jgi:uncharacterized phage-associated protein
MLNCSEVANYFLSLINEDDEDTISNMQLQKLVYFSQGFYLALYDEPLFEEPIEAWTYGPVVPSLYHDYKNYQGRSLPKPENICLEIYEDKIRELLDEIYVVYGQYSAWKLSEITHQHPTWKNHYLNTNDKTIPKQELQRFFKTLIEKDEKQIENS